MSLYKITSPTHKSYDVCRIHPTGVELLEGSGYDDYDISVLVTTDEPSAILAALPRSRGIKAELPRTGTHSALSRTLDTALADARRFYAGGFSEPIPA